MDIEEIYRGECRRQNEQRLAPEALTHRAGLERRSSHHAGTAVGSLVATSEAEGEAGGLALSLQAGAVVDHVSGLNKPALLASHKGNMESQTHLWLSYSMPDFMEPLATAQWYKGTDIRSVMKGLVGNLRGAKDGGRARSALDRMMRKPE